RGGSVSRQARPRRRGRPATRPGRGPASRRRASSASMWMCPFRPLDAARYVVRTHPAAGILQAMGFAFVDVGRATRAVRSILRPVGWRGLTPKEQGLERCLLFPRKKRATSFDGTEIAYSVFGRRGPWVGLVPG